MSSSQWISGSTGSFSSRSIGSLRRSSRRTRCWSEPVRVSPPPRVPLLGPRFERGLRRLPRPVWDHRHVCGRVLPLPGRRDPLLGLVEPHDLGQPLRVSRGPSVPGSLFACWGREHFVLTTNVDHQFQRGNRPVAPVHTQGDYGPLQCPSPATRQPTTTRPSYAHGARPARHARAQRAGAPPPLLRQGGHSQPPLRRHVRGGGLVRRARALLQDFVAAHEPAWCCCSSWAWGPTRRSSSAPSGAWRRKPQGHLRAGEPKRDDRPPRSPTRPCWWTAMRRRSCASSESGSPGAGARTPRDAAGRGEGRPTRPRALPFAIESAHHASLPPSMPALFLGAQGFAEPSAPEPPAVACRFGWGVGRRRALPCRTVAECSKSWEVLRGVAGMQSWGWRPGSFRPWCLPRQSRAGPWDAAERLCASAIGIAMACVVRMSGRVRASSVMLRRPDCRCRRLGACDTSTGGLPPPELPLGRVRPGCHVPDLCSRLRPLDPRHDG